MALIDWNGLDFFSSSAEFAAANPRYNGPYYGYWGAPDYVYTTGGRYGNGGRLYIDGNYNYSFIMDISDKAINNVWTGRSQSSPSSGAVANTYLFVARSNTGIEATVTVELDGTVKVYRGDKGTLLGNSAPGVFTRNTWTWLDIYYKMDTTTGGVEVWIDNSRVVSVTGANTKQYGSTSNTIISSVTIATAGTASNDDYYILDTTGAAPWNTRIGDARIVSLYPSADFGANSGTPSTGTAHWSVIDDSINTSDYLSMPINANTNTERFRVNTSALLSNCNIIALGLSNYSLKSDAGIANLRSVVINNSSGYVSNGNTKSIGTGWQPYFDFIQANPETGSQWTYDQIVNAHIALVATR